ncbi:PREDICTED: peroxisome biogenesis factor 1 [Ceratosolen solmsi marchali]|uniref:Peroxisomal ATPase PEX1 n=1 Tax=Ceratosolen solmsi marchali TaxID=326594 RepID=A0AAJ6YWP2_9HYME|nr:PREDICTED: peroxisome biogenesis factor 1 [Ceratosolen solmsi marchali]
MHNQRFIVKYIAVNTCYLYLPEYCYYKIKTQLNVAKVRHKEDYYYLSRYMGPSPDRNNVCLSATFARTLNINEGDEVFVSCFEDAPSLTSVSVSPKTLHDQEIVDMQTENIQSHLLNQIYIVAKNQSIVFWVSRSTSITLIVNSLYPNYKYGKLQMRTQVLVVNATELLKKDSYEIFRELFQPARPFYVYRVHPLLKSAADEVPYFPFHGYVHPMTRDDDVTNIFRLYKISDQGSFKTLSDFKFQNIDKSEPITITIGSLEAFYKNSNDVNKNYYTYFTKHPCIYLNIDIMNMLSINVGGKVILEPLNDENNNCVKCTAIDIQTTNDRISVEDFCSFIRRNSKNEKILLNSNKMFRLDSETCFRIALHPDVCSYAFFDEESIKNIRITTSNKLDYSNEDQQKEDFVIKNIFMDVFQSIITECTNVLTLSLGFHNITDLLYDRENILIKGCRGSGKTTVCKLLCNIFRKPPYFVHSRFIDCKELKDTKTDSFEELLLQNISYAVYYQPSILILDNIDFITNTKGNEEESGQDSMNATRITSAIYNIISVCQAQNYISVIATCTNISTVGKKLRETRGFNFFRTTLTIENLTKEDKIKILQSHIEDKLDIAKDIDWAYCGNKTEGWVTQDLVNLAKKAVFAASKRHVKDRCKGQVTLKNFELQDCLVRCKPNSVLGVKLYHGSGYGFSQVGGLAEVKHDLIEILHWPLKYSSIFSRAPIKLPNGILLYGMPGTGKTKLAGALAHEFNMNMISIKGPELMSKYIGRSEEAVRKVFKKANRTKPSILFFDEFESLAPRRGHDHTGVTDRVVNQLLTLLDGIEEREGMIVVAASSRPDLLDPALLRPGRLDKSLYCPLPNENEREEILSAICQAHEIHTQDLDLKSLACLTSGFTGADLNAALIQAWLNVIDKALEISSVNSEHVSSYCEKKISQKQLIDSINSTQPSLSSAEVEKYKRIYAKFTRNNNYPHDGFKNPRSTLA